MVAQLTNKEIIRVKWIFKTKLNPDGSMLKRKARFVVKGYVQQLEINYNESFVYVARMDTMKALVAQKE